MSGRLFKGILLLLVLFMACLMVSPISSGEHPWGSDRGDGEGDDVIDTGSVVVTDTTIEPTDTTLVLSGSGDEVVSVPTWFSFFTRVWSSISTVF